MKANYVSATLLTGVTIALEIERARAEQWLHAKLGTSLPVRLAPGLSLDGARSRTPILLDLWQLHAGRLEFRGRSQHAWLRSLGSRWGERASHAGQRRFGTYRESMFSLPGVYVGERGPFSLVLGMWADSRAACLVDQHLRYGYHKRLARCEYHALEPGAWYWHVSDQSGHDVVRASVRRRALDSATLPAIFPATFAMPLLGCPDLYRPQSARPALRTSMVQRDLHACAWTPLEGDVQLTCPQLDLLPSGYARWSTVGDHTFAIHYDSLRARVTTPADL